MKKVKCTTIINGRVWWIRTERHKIPSEQIKEFSSGWVKKEFPSRNLNTALKDAFNWGSNRRETGIVW